MRRALADARTERAGNVDGLLESACRRDPYPHAWAALAWTRATAGSASPRPCRVLVTSNMRFGGSLSRSVMIRSNSWRLRSKKCFAQRPWFCGSAAAVAAGRARRNGGRARARAPRGHRARRLRRARGDPDSIAFFERAGLDYVSCSPFRIPIARVAAAQARLS
jgi:hypothetical protein